MIGTTLWLSLIWLVGGAMIGALTVAARLRLPGGASAGSAPRGAGQAWATIGVGAVAALVGGWLGALVFGGLFGSPTALWVSVAAAVGFALAIGRRRAAEAPPDSVAQGGRRMTKGEP